MSSRFILKARYGCIPFLSEVQEFEEKYGVKVSEVKRLYVSFKEGKKKRLKRLRLKVEVHNNGCPCCGSMVEMSGMVGGKPFLISR